MIAIGIDRNPKSGSSGNTVNPFGKFESFSKGVFNCVPNTGPELEPGDIVHNGFKDLNTWWESAQYNGGDILDLENNYTPLVEVELDTNCSITDVEEVVNAVVSDWSAWSACVAGSQTRTRTVITPASGGGVTPILIDTQSCSIPVDAVVSDWSAWSACVAGSQTRTRTLITPASGGGVTPILIETQSCVVPVTCGEIVLVASNFTGEDLTYDYEDCDTGEKLFVTVPYGSQPVTVYGRVPNNINPFSFTQSRATAIESCPDTTQIYTLYSPASVLEVGGRIFEDAACYYTFSHGVIYMKDLATSKIWQVDNNGLLIAFTTC